MTRIEVILPGEGPLSREEAAGIVTAQDARYQRLVVALRRHSETSAEASDVLVAAIARYHEQQAAAMAELVATLEASL